MNRKIEVLSIVGTRPQYIKVVAIENSMKNQQVSHGYIDTGQHYSASLAKDVISDLNLSAPLVNLKVGPVEPILQISAIIEKLHAAITKINPKFILVYGDTNSTIAASIAALKMDLPIGHVEAGLRSFNRRMPEEINRVIADQIATRLYAPTQNAIENLTLEHLEHKSLLVGDLMMETLLESKKKVEEFQDSKFEYLVATFHREENMNSVARLRKIFSELSRIPVAIKLFAHPRLKKQLHAFYIELSRDIELLEPVPHSKLISFLINSKGLITDSGGLQKEAFMLEVVCTTVRDEIEWVETQENGWNYLVLDLSEIHSVALRPKPQAVTRKYFGEGQTSKLIVDDVVGFL